MKATVLDISPIVPDLEPTHTKLISKYKDFETEMNIRTIVNSRSDVQNRLEVAVHIIRSLETERQALIERQHELVHENDRLSSAHDFCRDLGYDTCELCHFWDHGHRIEQCENCDNTFCENCGYSCRHCEKKICDLCHRPVGWFNHWCHECKLTLKCRKCGLIFNDNFTLDNDFYDVVCNNCNH